MSSEPDPQVVLRTPLGEIVIELFGAAAPIGTRNFLAYVDKGLLANARFYRSVRPEKLGVGRRPMSLIQGGLSGSGVEALPPIEHESGSLTGLRHTRGAVSYARFEPGTASSEFFICVEDCPHLDATSAPVPPHDGFGYAVFGRVLEGMSVVEAIQQSATSEDAPIEMLRGQMICDPVRILHADRLAAGPRSVDVKKAHCRE